MSGALARRSLLLGAGSLLLGGCSRPDITRQIGNQAVYEKDGLRLFVVENAVQQRLHVSLVNTQDDVFVVYTSEASGGGWLVMPENGRVVLVYAPLEAKVPTWHGYAMDRELRLEKGRWWKSTVSLADFHKANDPRDFSPYYERLARSRVVTVEDIVVRVVAPRESLVGFDGGTKAHFRVYPGGWPAQSVGGELRLARPKRFLVDMAPRIGKEHG